MKKVTLLFVMFITLTLVSLVETVSGFVLWWALPRGGGKWALTEPEFWGLSRETWLFLHDWGAVLLVALVVVHILLHWRWVINMFKKYFAFINLRKTKPG